MSSRKSLSEGLNEVGLWVSLWGTILIVRLVWTDSAQCERQHSSGLRPGLYGSGIGELSSIGLIPLSALDCG